MTDERKDLEEIRSKVSDMGIGSPVPDGICEELYRLARKFSALGPIAEIGSGKGKSTVYIARGSMAGGRQMVYAVDPHTGGIDQRMAGATSTFMEFVANISIAGVKPFVSSIVLPSEEVAGKFPDGYFGLLVVDGDKNPNEALKDFEKWYPKVVPGGALAFVDPAGEISECLIGESGLCTLPKVVEFTDPESGIRSAIVSAIKKGG